MNSLKQSVKLKNGTKFTRESYSQLELVNPRACNRKKMIIVIVVLAFILLASACGESGSGQAKIEVLDVTGMDYPDALKTLQEAGFTNIVSNVDSSSDSALWVVSDQSAVAGKSINASDKIELTCKMKCKLYLDLSSEFNLLFGTYDISISLDDDEVGTITNGGKFSFLADVLSGDHQIVFCRAGNTSPKAIKKIKVSGDMTYSCYLLHDSSSIDLKNENTSNEIVGAYLEVIDVTGMVLSEAMEILSNIGFMNLKEEPYGEIWNKDNWIVTGQGLAAGTVTDKNAYIQLDCISLNDYFNDTYAGKNLNEVEKLARQSGFSLKCEGSDWNEYAGSSMDGASKDDWTVVSARQYAGMGKTAVVTVEFTGMIPEEEEQPVIEETEPETEEQPVMKETEPEAEEAEPAHEQTKYSDSEVQKYITGVLGTVFGSGNFSDSDTFRVTVEKALVNVYFTPEGITTLAYCASELKDKPALEAWNSLVASAKQWSKDLENAVHNNLNRPDLNVSLYYCHDQGSTNVLLIAMNGTVYYDYVNNVNLIGLN